MSTQDEIRFSPRILDKEHPGLSAVNILLGLVALAPAILAVLTLVR